MYKEGGRALYRHPLAPIGQTDTTEDITFATPFAGDNKGNFTCGNILLVTFMED